MMIPIPAVELDAHIVMPNHVHGNMVLRAEQFQKPVAGSIPTIIRSYKAAVTRRIGRELNTTGIWQRNYYKHVTRNERDLQNQTDYRNANHM